MMYDVIVVGARCAGSPLAMLLARKGYRVALVDRATFPSDVPHGHVILYRGMQFMRDWGLPERVEASNCPPMRRHTFDLGDFPLSVTLRRTTEFPARSRRAVTCWISCWSTRRLRLELSCAKAAQWRAFCGRASA